MSRARPSLALHATIDEDGCSDELIARLKRTYAYIAPITVKSGAGSGCDDRSGNVLRCDIRLNAPYWDGSDPDAEDRWRETVVKWLHNMFYKISATSIAGGRSDLPPSERLPRFSWIELKFGANALVSLATQEDGSLADGAIGLIEHGRRLIASGALGEGVSSIRMPSPSSLAAKEDVASQSCETCSPPHEDRIPDMTIWEITYADSTVREFDSSSESFVSQVDAHRLTMTLE